MSCSPPSTPQRLGCPRAEAPVSSVPVRALLSDDEWQALLWPAGMPGAPADLPLPALATQAPIASESQTREVRA
jgi:hypothetical protein